MIYLFGTGKSVSIVYNGKYLTEAQKALASVSTGRMPKHEIREGFIARPMVDPETKEIQYYYEEIVEEE